LGVYCTVGNTGCIPEGKEEQADLGRKKGEKRWCSTLGGGGGIRRRKIKVSIGSDGVSAEDKAGEQGEEHNTVNEINENGRK
jgi:hypothetical protein